MDSLKPISPNCYVTTHVKSRIGLQFVIFRIRGWKITYAWPNFEPL